MEELIRLIMKRDNISYNEAASCVRECREEIYELINEGSGYDAVADCIADYLSLQPDYMDILIPL